jgi:protein phosphatase
MAAILGGAFEGAPQQLVRSALDAGSTDNVTVVIAELVDGDQMVDPAPVVVGAAATAPHLARHDSTGNLTDAEVSDLGQYDDAVDPEDLRYAPRAPRGRTWLRRLVALAILLGLVGFGGYKLYEWSQDQYYVGLDDDDEVVIFRGVEIDLPLVDLNSVQRRTGLDLADLPESVHAQVRDGSARDNGLAGAEAFVTRLRGQCAETIDAEASLPEALLPARGDWFPQLSGHAAVVAQKCGVK